MITIDVEEQLEAFEAAIARGESAVALLPSFLPAESAADYFPTLVELLRITLEHEVGQGTSPDIERYRPTFPELFARPDRLEPLAFEEYRLRCAAGETCAKEEFARRFGIAVSDWPDLTPGSTKHSTAGAENSDDWMEFSRSEPDSALGAIAARRTLPQVGEAFGSFQLIALLGEGAFGRVFLARQQTLAGRLVALKITCGPTAEAQKLARLQHGNIMPVYSVHRRGRLSGICMPFLGSATLADVIRGFQQAGAGPKSAEFLIKTLEQRRARLSTLQEGVSTRDTSAADGVELPLDDPKLSALQSLRADSLEGQVLRIMLQVADGLVQAHERGILHRDIKPANILIADDGQPLLLDFNLAVEQSAHAARIGGTLPYMSPEQLAQFQESKRKPLDGRSDIYSLGSVMYEFLTGQPPFAVRRGEITRVIQEMLADRSNAPPSIQTWNRAISPGLAAIVERCLQPDPQQRYQRADQLRNDLKSHAENRPLLHAKNPSFGELMVKWSRRHPRLTSISTVLLVAAFLATAAGAIWYSREEKLANQMAGEVFRSTEEDLLKARSLLLVGGRGSDTAQAGKESAIAGLERYQVLSNSHWTSAGQVRRLSEAQQRQLGRDVSEVLLLLGRSQGSTQGPAALHAPQKLESIAEQSWRMLVAQGQQQAALDADSQAILALADGPQSESWNTIESTLKDLTNRRPRDAFAWLALAHFYRLQAKLPAAETAATAAVALRPDLELAWQLRGMVYLAQRRWQDAEEDFSRALELRSDSPSGGQPTAWFNRGIACQEQGQHAAAVTDFTAAIEQGFRETRVYFSRGKSHQALGELEAAAADLERGQKLEPSDALSYVARALSYLPQDAVAAVRDLELAQRLDPTSRLVLMNLAHVQSEHLHQTAEALDVLAEIKRLCPGDTDAIGSRAVLFARLQKRDEAVAELKQLLQVDVRPPLAIYQSACVYALLSKDQPALRAQALQLLATSFATQPSLANTARDDADLASLRDDPLFAQLTQASKKPKPE